MRDMRQSSLKQRPTAEGGISWTVLMEPSLPMSYLRMEEAQSRALWSSTIAWPSSPTRSH